MIDAVLSKLRDSSFDELSARLTGMVGVNILGVLLGAGFVALAAAWAGIEEFGRFAVAQAVAEVTAMLAVAGAPRAVLRSVAKEGAGAQQATVNGFATLGPALAVGCVLGTLTGFVADKIAPSGVSVVYVGLMSGLFGALAVAVGMLRGAGAQVAASLFAQPIRLIVQIGLLAVIASVGTVSSFEIGLVNIAGVSAGLIACLLFGRRRCENLQLLFGRSGSGFTWDTSIWRTDLLAILAQRGDLMVVGLIASADQTGLFAIASRIGRSISIGQTAVFLAGADRFAQLWQAGLVAELDRLFRRLQRVGYGFGGFLFLLVAVLSFPVLVVLLPEAVAAFPAVILIALGRLLSSGSGPAAQLLVMADSANKETLAHAVATGVLMCAVALGASVAGAVGAATGVLLADVARATILTASANSLLKSSELRSLANRV